MPEVKNLNGCQEWFVNSSSERMHEMLDSWGRAGSGSEVGNLRVWPGDYEECRTIGGRHCWLRGTRTPSSHLFVGVCVPKSCNETTVETSLGQIQHITENNIDLWKTFDNFTVQNVECEKPFDVTAGAVVAWCFLLLLWLLVSVGTLLDIWTKRSSSEPLPCVERKRKKGVVYGTLQNLTTSEPVQHEQREQEDQDREGIVLFVVKSFSLVSNWRQLMTAKPSMVLQNQGQKNLGCLHGMRVICTLAIILGHQFLIVIINPELRQLLLLIPNKIYVTVSLKMLFFTVDTFFVISGFLLVYIFKQRAETMATSWILFYVHRYVRLTPAMLVTILTFVYVFPMLGQGPFWSYTRRPFHQQCLDTWWWYPLYINNFLGKKSCLVWLWYLACDMQFYAISPVFLFILQKNVRLGMVSIFLCLLCSMVLTFSFSYAYDVKIFFLLPHKLQLDVEPAFNDGFEKIMDIIYVSPFVRVGAYLIGMLLGVVVSFEIHPTTRLMTAAGWVGSGLLMILAVAPLAFEDLGRTLNALFNSSIHVAWAILLAWLILNCVNGRAGYMNKFLSHPVWIIPSRLTYCVYLVHYMVVGASYAGMKNTLPISWHFFVNMLIGNVALSYAWALVLSLSVEAPFQALCKASSKN